MSDRLIKIDGSLGLGGKINVIQYPGLFTISGIWDLTCLGGFVSIFRSLSGVPAAKIA
jgi:hypothetical protein